MDARGVLWGEGGCMGVTTRVSLRLIRVVYGVIYILVLVRWGYNIES